MNLLCPEFVSFNIHKDTGEVYLDASQQSWSSSKYIRRRNVYICVTMSPMVDSTRSVTLHCDMGTVWDSIFHVVLNSINRHYLKRCPRSTSQTDTSWWKRQYLLCVIMLYFYHVCRHILLTFVLTLHNTFSSHAFVIIIFFYNFIFGFCPSFLIT